MHPFRLLPVLAVLAATPQLAHADDDWFQKQFGSEAVPTRTVPAAAPGTSAPISATTSPSAAYFVPTPQPAPRPWRTVAVPAAQTTTLQTGTLSPQPSRHASAAPALKPLTGYAHELSGLASYYWQEQMTSSGERFDRNGMTAAHRTLPLGTRVRVTNLANGMSTVVRINDRGPFKPGRIIDLSEAAAQQIKMTGPGIARVALDVMR